MKNEPPNQHRETGRHLGLYNSSNLDGMNGAFSIPLSTKTGGCWARCIVSDGRGMPEAGMEPWEHVSVHIDDKHGERTPTWEEMCVIKNYFWDEEEVVVQFHPAKSHYVNVHPHVLHLWRRPSGFPIPPKVCV